MFIFVLFSGQFLSMYICMTDFFQCLVDFVQQLTVVKGYGVCITVEPLPQSTTLRYFCVHISSLWRWEKYVYLSLHCFLSLLIHLLFFFFALALRAFNPRESPAKPKQRGGQYPGMKDSWKIFLFHLLILFIYLFVSLFSRCLCFLLKLLFLPRSEHHDLLGSCPFVTAAWRRCGITLLPKVRALLSSSSYARMFSGSLCATMFLVTILALEALLTWYSVVSFLLVIQFEYQVVPSSTGLFSRAVSYCGMFFVSFFSNMIFFSGYYASVLSFRVLIQLA